MRSGAADLMYYTVMYCTVRFLIEYVTTCTQYWYE